MEQLKEFEWKDLKETDEPLELHLTLCTGIILYDSKQNSSRVLHIPQLYPKNILEREMMGGKTVQTLIDEYPASYVYMVSGIRGFCSDLLLAKHIILSEKHQLSAAELKKPTRMQIYPKKKAIELYSFKEYQLQKRFELGKEYSLELRTELLTTA